ncbi:hypothetical protein C2S51_015023 [Perilla frutescens var. frutescens]|nr:hypothetical protein C2S51_015023 [Perilla frutescens var. frutescens]
MFPKLKQVDLCNMPNLTTFCQGIESIEFPLLMEMRIDDCPKMRSIISTTLNGIGSNLNSSGDTSNVDVGHLFRQPEKVSFGSLKKLTIERVSENPFNRHKIPVSSFNELKVLKIIENHSCMSLFTSSIAENLVSLEELCISKCDEMIEVIKDEKVVSGGQRTLVFPKLWRLELEDLCELVTFCEWKWDVELPSLRRLHIYNCPNMTNFSLGPISSPNLKFLETDLSNYLDVGVNVSSGNLKHLYTQRIENPLRRHKLPVSFFNGLKWLRISKDHGSMSLFSSSIAENLVNLTQLYIHDCDKMVIVIEGEKEEEKVVSGGQRTHLFPNLQELILSRLFKLVTFCEWKCDVELPSLWKVCIDNCPYMKNFTLGPLTTPKLEDVRKNYRFFVTPKDLNYFLIGPEEEQR